MALTPSTMLPLGTPAPAFSLPEPATGRTVSLHDHADAPAFVVMFLCNHCPYVHHVRTGVAAFAREYMPRGVAVVGINSNDAARFPEDGPDRMKGEVLKAGYTFPYLHDESQAVARAYQAACTPDFFLFGPDRRLAYRGQFDASRPGNGIPVTGGDLRAAVEAVLTGRPIAGVQKPSVGCNIKWKG
ncbi:MAG TPA: thioredoxin family protein [Verrucomicrobiales bacterium]|nr:thioredoxin family protein [Verrucomicrobiales bacterium]